MSDESRNKNSIYSETTTSSIIPSNSNKNLLTINQFKYIPPKRKPLSTPDLSLTMSNKIRKDIFGEIIRKGGKQKISFADNVLLSVIEDNEDNEKNNNNNNSNNNSSSNSSIIINKKKTIHKYENIAEVIDVESYKKLNKLMNFEGNNDKEIICCETCNIF